MPCGIRRRPCCGHSGHCSVSSAIFYAMAVAFNWWMFYNFKTRTILSKTNLGDVSIEFPSHMQGFVNPHVNAADGLSCHSILTYSRCQDHTAAWGDWKACMERHLGSIGWQKNEDREPGADSPFSAFIFRCKARSPWTTQSSYTAVLLEFRALEREMRFSVDNVMNNLPMDWQMQIVGGADVCKLAFELYPAEIAAQKVIVTFLPYDDVQQSQISEILTDKAGFYDKLKGDTWLFFQYDSVICSQQRHLLHTFIERDYGWWGAPWDFWGRRPKMCGNGGFSLRKREFIETILASSPWKDALSEDMYFCHAAANLYDELPPSLRPAPMAEETVFAVETMWYEAPFAIHKFWPHLHVSTPAMATKIIEHCPEALGILPGSLVANQTVWRDIVCAARIDRGAFNERSNITFNFDRVCV